MKGNHNFFWKVESPNVSFNTEKKINVFISK